MPDFFLRAETEQLLIDALPWFRGVRRSYADNGEAEEVQATWSGYLRRADRQRVSEEEFRTAGISKNAIDWDGSDLSRAYESITTTITTTKPKLTPVDEPCWVTGGQFHALNASIVVELTPAIRNEQTGAIVVPAETDPRFHLNLRLDQRHPDFAAVVEAMTPFVVVPANPSCVFG
jgi:hypothetical protein